MGAPAYIDNGGIAFNAGASVDVPYPGTVNANDLLIMQILDAAPDEFATPVGWTLITTSSKHGEMSAVWFAMRADGTEAGTETVVSDSADGNGIYGVMSRYSGCREHGSPIESEDWDGPDRWNTYTSPSCTPTGEDRLIIALVCVEDNVTVDPPAVWDGEHFEVQSASGDGCSLACEYIEPADYTGVVADEGALGGSAYRACAIMALIPESTPGLIVQATADISVTSDAVAKSAVRVNQATADISVTSDAIIKQKATIGQATADITVETDAKVMDPWMEDVEFISEMQTEVKFISNMN